MTPRAVVFEFEAVIADVENVRVASWERTLDRLGWDVPAEVCARGAASDERAFLAGLFADRGIVDADVDGWVSRRRSLVASMLADFPRVYPGVAGLIAVLRDRAPLGIVTAGPGADVASVLAASGLAGAFATVVACEDAPRPGSDPPCFGMAAGRLGAAPADVVALVGSPRSLDAARAAGVRPLAVAHRSAVATWPGVGTPLLRGFSDLPAVIRAVGL